MTFIDRNLLVSNTREVHNGLHAHLLQRALQTLILGLDLIRRRYGCHEHRAIMRSLPRRSVVQIARCDLHGALALHDVRGLPVSFILFLRRENVDESLFVVHHRILCGEGLSVLLSTMVVVATLYVRALGFSRDVIFLYYKLIGVFPDILRHLQVVDVSLEGGSMPRRRLLTG